MSILFVGIDDPFFMAVSKRLVEQGCDIAAVFTINPQATKFAMPATAVIDSRLLYRAGDVCRAFAGVQPVALSKATVVALLECERYFLILTDRSNYEPTSVKERKRLLRELTRYFLAFFERHKDIDVVFFESTPHMGWDMVLFFVSKLVGRRTLILTRTHLADQVLLVEDFRVPPSPVPNRPRLDGERRAALIAPSAWSQVSAERNEDALRRNGHLNWKDRLLAPVRRWRLAHRSPRFVSAIAAAGAATPKQVNRLRRDQSIRAAHLREAYRQVVTQPPPGPYAYFALHFQPERTTQPEGLEFEDQWLALDILSRALPEGWSIVVKEHPRQFETRRLPLRLRHARVPYDYTEMASIPKVRFAALEANSADLLRGAKLAATITGSTGWEALQLGKPAIVFGPCWYSGCAAVALVSSVDEAQDACRRLSAKKSRDVEADVEQFLADIEPLLIHSTTAEAYAKRSRAPYDLLVGNLCRAIRQRTVVSAATS